MKVLSPHAEQVIIPVMKPKKLPVLKRELRDTKDALEILKKAIGILGK